MIDFNTAINSEAKKHGFEFTDNEVLMIISKHWNKIGPACSQDNTFITNKVLEDVILTEIKNRKNGAKLALDKDNLNIFSFLKNAMEK